MQLAEKNGARMRWSPYHMLGRVLHLTPSRARENVWGYLMISPWLIGLMFFIVGPILICFYYSFTEFAIIKPPRWIGLDNYARALDLGRVMPQFSSISGDRLVYPAIGKTLLYAGIVVPLGTVGSLLFALMLNQGLRGTNVLRTVFFMPHLIPSIVTVMIWRLLMHPSLGIINLGLAQLGISGPGWMKDTRTAMLSLILIGLWNSIGGNPMLIYLAGLQGVPVDLYEAADLDGAGSWQKLWNVTLPMISPTVLFNVLLGVISALKVFTVAFVGTAGGPAYATWFYALHIYQQAFAYSRLGYGSALSWIFAFILILFTILQIQVSKRWVFYGGGGE